MTALPETTTKNVVLAMTGASGALYGVRLLEVLLAAGCDVHAVVSGACQRVFEEELGLSPDPKGPKLDQFLPTGGDAARRLNSLRPVDRTAALGRPLTPDGKTGRAVFHSLNDYSAGIASGSFRTSGMVICPLSLIHI